jgi:hypothetical protein
MFGHTIYANGLDWLHLRRAQERGYITEWHQGTDDTLYVTTSDGRVVTVNPEGIDGFILGLAIAV